MSADAQQAGEREPDTAEARPRLAEEVEKADAAVDAEVEADKVAEEQAEEQAEERPRYRRRRADEDAADAEDATEALEDVEASDDAIAADLRHGPRPSYLDDLPPAPGRL